MASTSVPEAQRRALHAVYEALAVAAELFDLRNRHQPGFDFADAAEMYRAYESELFRFDQLHRHFCWNADLAALQGWDMLKPLRESVEACYRNGYLAQLGLAWGKFVSFGLLESWRIEGVPNQYKFFDHRVGQRLKEAERRRVFVIVSDALRYEIAEELTRLINGIYRFQAELGSQLGVLPSYTALAMKDKKSREKTRPRSVLVQVLGTKHKITAPKHRFQLIQMEEAGFVLTAGPGVEPTSVAL